MSPTENDFCLSPGFSKQILFNSIAASAVLAGVLLGGAVDTAQAQSAAENAYYNSQYGYCDAKKIARVWGTDAGQGKTIIGNKLLAGLTHLANADIKSTDVSTANQSRQVYCSWEETDLSYRDAVALGRYWNQSPNQAKTTAAYMASKMGTFKLRQVFYSALRSSVEPQTTTDFANVSPLPPSVTGANVLTTSAKRTLVSLNASPSKRYVQHAVKRSPTG